MSPSLKPESAEYSISPLRDILLTVHPGADYPYKILVDGEEKLTLVPVEATNLRMALHHFQHPE